MRRFLVDALLVLLLVSLASYINEPQAKKEISEKITEFEDEVARHDPLTQKVETSRLNEIHENPAARMAETGSNLVINVMEGSMQIVSELFHGFWN